MKEPIIRPFGTLPDGTRVEQYTLESGAFSCDILTYGGTLRALRVPNRQGGVTDILLGFDTLEDYCRQDKYIGALIGRYANRIGGSQFSLDGKQYKLYANDGANHLHGGKRGFDKQVWRVEAATRQSLSLALDSPDGEEGYPGNLHVLVTYTLGEDGLSIRYQAQSDGDTLCCLTNHAYFNLAGHAGGSVEAQQIQVNAKFYTPTDSASIPTGEICPVDGTPMDLRKMQTIGSQIDADFPQLVFAGGYDHNWVICGDAGTLRPASCAFCPETGISMEVLTTLPGIQFYSGNYLDGCPNGKDGAPYKKRCGFCLETQYFPDTPHHENFPSAVLEKGQLWDQLTVFRFGDVTAK